MAFRSPVRTRSQASERNQNIGNEERTEEAGQSQEDIHILRAEIEALRIELEREKLNTNHNKQSQGPLGSTHLAKMLPTVPCLDY